MALPPEQVAAVAKEMETGRTVDAPELLPLTAKF
jgi:hypothetical protein